jgi:6-phosphogluconolactonase
MSIITVNSFSDSQKLSSFGAELLAQMALAAVSERGRFLAALSGGGTPMALYNLLAQSPYRESLSWERMLFFWGDERCVPPDDDESCYHQAYQAWLSQVPVPEKNIYRIKGELGALKAAEDYASKLRTLAEPGLDWPRFDLVLLGLGADGHTASLFPGSVETQGVATVAAEAFYQDRPAERVSLTPDVINSARKIVFLAVGSEKARAMADTLCGPREPARLPAQRILPVAGELSWLVDEAAASLLPEHMDGVTLQRHA